MSFFQMASIGLSLYGAYEEKKAGDKASAFAAAIGEENAKIIERDIDIADRQIEILGRNLELSNERKGKGFNKFRGAGTAIYGGSGVELSRGAPVTVELASAAEFEYELSVDAYNTSTNQPQKDLPMYASPAPTPVQSSGLGSVDITQPQPLIGGTTAPIGAQGSLSSGGGLRQMATNNPAIADALGIRGATADLLRR